MMVSRRALLAGAGATLLAAPARAQPVLDHAALADRALDQHVLPAFDRLAAASATLSEAASAACADATARPALETAFHEAFDAWCGADHFRFGALEEDGRAYSIAFWPDTRGRTNRVITSLIAAEDPVIDDPAAFSESSVAARGLFALDYVMFDPDAPPLDGYRCRLVAAIARDLAMSTETLAARWRDPHAGLLRSAGAPDNPLYLTEQEATLAFYRALIGGLEFDADLRVGRPLGDADRPRPRRAEAWRSGRSLRNLTVSVRSLHAYFHGAFAPITPEKAADTIDEAFRNALAALEHAPSPLDAAVADPETWTEVRRLRVRIDAVRETISTLIGSLVGAGVSFNALDGD